MGPQMIKNEGWRNTSKQAPSQQASSGRLGGWFCDVGDGRVARGRKWAGDARRWDGARARDETSEREIEGDGCDRERERERERASEQGQGEMREGVSRSAGRYVMRA